MTTPDFEDWLRSTEEPIPIGTEDEYVSYLEDELGIHDGSLDVAKDVYREDITADLTYHGVRGIQITYPWGTDVRYAIQGMAGLWNWESVQKIRAGEEW